MVRRTHKSHPPRKPDLYVRDVWVGATVADAVVADGTDGVPEFWTRTFSADDCGHPMSRSFWSEMLNDRGPKLSCDVATQTLGSWCEQPAVSSNYYSSETSVSHAEEPRTGAETFQTPTPTCVNPATSSGVTETSASRAPESTTSWSAADEVPGTSRSSASPCQQPPTSSRRVDPAAKSGVWQSPASPSEDAAPSGESLETSVSLSEDSPPSFSVETEENQPAAGCTYGVHRLIRVIVASWRKSRKSRSQKEKCRSRCRQDAAQTVLIFGGNSSPIR